MANSLEKLSLEEFKIRYSYHVFTKMIGKTPPISRAFISPLRDEKHASFNVYQDKTTGEYLFKDFGADLSGDCIKFVELIKNIDFKSVLELMEKEFNCTISDETYSKPAFNNTKSISQQPQSNQSIKPFGVKDRIPFNQQEAEYFKQYKIKPEILKKYSVLALDSYTFINNAGKEISIKRKDGELFFFYNHGSWGKIYKPLSADRSFRFQHLGEKPPDFSFGYKQLPESGDLLLITGGEKDVLTLSSLDFNAIALNSETAFMQNEIAEDLKSRFKEVIVLYDSDPTGISSSEKLCRAYGFKQALFPNGIFTDGEKDISDFVKKGLGLEQLIPVLQNAQLFQPDNQISTEQCMFTAVELLALGKTDPDFLIEHIFPRIGTAVLAGKPDTGKSQLCRQLCISVAKGDDSIFNFSLNPIHKRAIYVSTEDPKDATSYLLYKQLAGLDINPPEDLILMFADLMDQEEIIKRLEVYLKTNPVDLIVIDSFGDIFTFADSNNNTSMRNTIRKFSRIAEKYSCLILFVHHINKGGYRLSPGQEHIQGGAGLVQKVRSAIQLSEGNDDIRYFTVVKGNYCPKEHKVNSLILHFSEDNFLFKFSGETIPTSEIGSNNNSSGPDPIEKLSEIAETILKHTSLKYTELSIRIMEVTNKSMATAKRYIPKMKEEGIIEEKDGYYFLANKINLPVDEDLNE
jgi:hypothetical protein